MQIGATIAALLIAATPLAAQDRPIEVGGGYSTLTVRGDYGRWRTNQGFAIDFALFLAPTLSLVVDTAGHFDTTPLFDGESESSRFTTVAGGVRVSGRRRRVVPMAQALVGRAFASATLTAPTGAVDLGSAAVSIAQFGGGVDVAVAGRVAVRAGLDAIILDPSHGVDWEYPEWRLVVGAAYRFSR